MQLLRRHDGEAKIIAGGQSLMPMLNFRLLHPTALIDISKIEQLRGIEEIPGGLRIGAMTRHCDLLSSSFVKERFPVLSEAMRHVAHLAIRNRGTIGGSLSHADPAAELPMMALLLDAAFEIAGAAGNRTVDAAAFFLGALTTDLEEDEILTAMTVPDLPMPGAWGFREVARRAGDFAIAAGSCVLAFTDDRVSDARIAVMGVDEVPLRITEAEALLRDHGRGADAFDAALAAKAATIARETVQPNSDLHGSADYRRHLVERITAQILRDAWQRARNDQNKGTPS